MTERFKIKLGGKQMTPIEIEQRVKTIEKKIDSDIFDDLHNELEYITNDDKTM